MGDPRRDSVELMHASPLYRYGELKVPLLVVHGTEDERVDYEHTRRLVRMLSMAGRPPQLVELAGGGHGVASTEDRKRVWPIVAKFLQDHLGEP
ncbi:alpha/beta hydrolase family protein [Dokdonella sp.]|uniref:alpha/beta hydrolase family protein n=1 Tax=Dokdonella sp. TaxID=2291710 RepID=UPI002F429E7D